MQAITPQNFKSLYNKFGSIYSSAIVNRALSGSHHSYFYLKIHNEKNLSVRTSLTSHFISKRNYSTEVSNPVISNLQENSLKYKKLFSPMNIGKIRVKNRIVLAPMGIDAGNPDGTVSERAIAYYTERAKNDVGLLIIEYTRINESDGVSAVGQLSLATDHHIEGVKKLVDSVHRAGAKIVIQIQHPGRQTVPIFPTIWPTVERLGKIVPGFWKKYDNLMEKMKNSGKTSNEDDPVKMKKKQRFLRPNLAPSQMPEDPSIALSFVKHRAMTLKEIHRIEQEFIDAARRAKEAGADGVELHATHGYLLQQFLSPFTNRRTDEYGGSFENRCRIVKELITGIKKVCGQDYPVLVRLTADECEDRIGHPERGYHLDEGIRFAKEFEKYGADAIDVSYASTDTSFLISESMRQPLGCRKEMVSAVKKALSIPVIGVGLIRTPDQAEAILNEGGQDFIGLGRPLLADSQWASKAKEGHEDEISRCICCMRCMETVRENSLNNDSCECSLNPRLCKEYLEPILPPKDGNRRKVVVVGAGPAGLVAARELALRDFSVTLFEKETREGGQILLAEKPPKKDRIIWCTEDFRVQAEKANVVFRMGEKATLEKIRELNPEYIIIATGGYALHPRLPGADAKYVCTSTPVLKGEVCPSNKNVVVVGSGLTGLETAELLTNFNNKVTVVEMADKIAPGVGDTHTAELLFELNQKKVNFLTGHKLEEIKDHTVILTTTKDGRRKVIPVDVVVLSLGVQRDLELANQLRNSSIPYHIIGDAKKPGRIVDAVQDAFKIARSLK